MTILKIKEKLNCRINKKNSFVACDTVRVAQWVTAEYFANAGSNPGSVQISNCLE